VNVAVIFVLLVHVIVSIGLIIFVLLHSGKGTGVSSMFGGMMPSTSSGTGIIEKNLDRITIILAVVFALTSITLMLIYKP
jgi:preprotein translocase subunit SecG